jgi:DNA topoisomerase-1
VVRITGEARVTPEHRRRPGLHRTDPPGQRRWVDDGGAAVTDTDLLDRLARLAIPPAWRGVWASLEPTASVQATGVDAGGRIQYRYSAQARAAHEADKFAHLVLLAEALPRIRDHVSADLAGAAATTQDPPARPAVLAALVRLLDRGFFRVGGEEYAVRNTSYGLATMKRRHVRLVRDGVLVFDYPAKSGKRRVQAVIDPASAAVVARLKRRRGGSDELLAYKRGRRWADLRSEDINAWLKEATGKDVSAKDFRTWGATVLAAVALSVSEDAPDTAAGRRRAVKRAIDEVAHYLGNTPAIARASYIDPRVLDRYQDGEVIEPRLVAAAADRDDDATAIQGPVERAVLKLIDA